MTIIASLIFMIALYGSVVVTITTIRKAMPRMREVVNLEFAPLIPPKRRIFLGEMRRPAPAQIIDFSFSYTSKKRSPAGRLYNRLLTLERQKAKQALRVSTISARKGVGKSAVILMPDKKATS